MKNVLIIVGLLFCLVGCVQNQTENAPTEQKNKSQSTIEKSDCSSEKLKKLQNIMVARYEKDFPEKDGWKQVEARFLSSCQNMLSKVLLQQDSTVGVLFFKLDSTATKCVYKGAIAIPESCDFGEFTIEGCVFGISMPVIGIEPDTVADYRLDYDSYIW